MCFRTSPAAVSTATTCSPPSVGRRPGNLVRAGSPPPDGPEGLRGLIGSLTDDVRHEVARVIAEGDLVAVHGVHYGFGPDPMVAFDLFRVADGKLAEHWDGLTPQVTKTVSGRSQVDGPAEASDLDRTEANRALVLEFAEKVLKGGDFSVVTDFISTEQYEPAPPRDR